MKRIIVIASTIFIVIIIGFQFIPHSNSIKSIVPKVKSSSLINQDSLTIKSRVNELKGYKRVSYPNGSFEAYLRNYKLKHFRSKIINYDETEYFWQGGHIGVLEIPVPKNGLQQCADALIRIRSEYLWDNDRKDEIGFNFTSGHYCSWNEYAKGYRPKINGNKVTFLKTHLPACPLTRLLLNSSNSRHANWEFQFVSTVFQQMRDLGFAIHLISIPFCKHEKILIGPKK